MVELLKRNHDVLMDKYELFRRRNETLEKSSAEKENLYNEMKIETDRLSQKLFQAQRNSEDLKNSYQILEQKFKLLE